MIDTKREQIQEQALSALLRSANPKGQIRATIEIITGLGKTFIALHLIKHLLPPSILFLAETTMREADIMADIVKFRDLYAYDILANHKVTFACYQSAYKWKHEFYDLVVADEIHDSLTPEYFKFYQNNHYTHLLGLSATIDRKTTYALEDREEFSKMDLLSEIAPIVFRYTVAQGQEDETSRKLKVFIVRHKLEDKIADVEVVYVDKKTGEKKKWMQTEQGYYDYCHSRFIQQLYSPNKSEFLIRYWANKRNAVLTGAKSKTRAIMRLLPFLNRTIVFGNSIEELTKICPTVSSKNDRKTNDQILEDFQKGKLNTIGSFKMLKQGKNLVGLNNVVMHSYYSVEKDFIQRIGRLRQAKDFGYVFMYVTTGTQESVWFKKIMEAVDMEYTLCESTEDAIEKYIKIKTQ